MKVTFYSYKSYDKQWFNKFNKDFNFEIKFLRDLLEEETADLAHGSDAICAFVNDDLSRGVIEKLHEEGVKMIAMRCAGFNNVDIQATEEFGIKVYRVPAYSPHAVAEHAVALILTLNRKTHKAYNRVRDGNFSLSRLTGHNIYGKTVGVLGTGKIGASFARIMKGFGCKVILYDKFENKELIEEGMNYHNLADVLQLSDIISLHLPLMPETSHIINAHNLSLMKDGAMLINTSRGGLINTRASIDALKTGKLGYLGIDVYEQEDGLFFHNLQERIINDDTLSVLLSFPNVLITAHQAYFTNEALDEIAKTTLKNIQDFSEGIENDNIVKLHH